MKDLIDLERRPVEEVVADLKGSRGESVEKGGALVREAADYGLNMRDFLTLAVNTREGEHAEFAHRNELNGYELALAQLDLPVRNDFENGVVLQAASETFQKYPGTRAMFPEVIDDMLQWSDRQDQIESVAPMLAQSRTVAGTELLSTVVEDDSAARGTHAIAELANIPVRTIRTSEKAVTFFKHGSGIRTSYEFSRRASLDMLTPYAARVRREKELSKVKALTSILWSGDGVNGAAGVEAITSHGGTANDLSANYKAVAKFLMGMAKDGVAPNVLVGNYDMFVDLMFMYTQVLSSDVSEKEKMEKVGTPAIGLELPILNDSVEFILSSSAPAGQLCAYNRAETAEELVEAGSTISESDSAIKNQSITYVNTENSGFRLIYGDTRRVLDTTA